MMEEIRMEHVTFSYQDTPVLTDLNLSVKAGEYVVLTGENGSGKSTLMKLLTGEQKPDSGMIKVFDHLVTEAFHDKRIGYVPQNSISRNQGFPATVEEVMMTGLYGAIGHFRFPRKQHREWVRQKLREFDMEEFAKQRIGDLSGGQQQRVMLARAMAGCPKLLLLDEPAAGVDANRVEMLYELLQKINEASHVTILMITHGDLESCSGASRILRLREGRLETL